MIIVHLTLTALAAPPPPTVVVPRTPPSDPILERWDDPWTTRVPRGAHARVDLENWNNHWLDLDVNLGLGTTRHRGLQLGVAADLGLGADSHVFDTRSMTPLRTARVTGWVGTLGDRWTHTVGLSYGGLPGTRPYRFRFVPEETDTHVMARYVAQVQVGPAQITSDVALGYAVRGRPWFATWGASVMGPLSRGWAMSMAVHHTSLASHRATAGLHVRPGERVELGFNGGMLFWVRDLEIDVGPLAVVTLKVWGDPTSEDGD